MLYIIYNRSCSKTSAFGTASLDLEEKPGWLSLGLNRFFQGLVSKLTEFWNNLNVVTIWPPAKNCPFGGEA
jgi:hypothetical protein